MTTPPHLPGPDRFWLWVLQGALLVPLLGLSTVLRGQLVSAFGLAVVGVYVALCATLWSRLRRLALRLVILLASLAFLGSGYIFLSLVLEIPEMGWKLLLGSGTFALAQLVVLVSATNVLSGTPVVSRGGVGLILTLVVILLVASAVTIPGLLKSRQAARESRAVGALREIRRCASAFAAANPKKGFPADAALLSSPPDRCLDADLVEGKAGGYRLSYQPGSADAAGRVGTYSIEARPLRYGRSGVTSFYSDESGAIHVTDKDRAATGSDPLRE